MPGFGFGTNRAARRRKGGAAPAVPAPTATFTMTQLASANRVYQRATSTGGGQGKGQGTVPVTISGATAGTINARLRSAADGVTITQAEWQAATIAGGATTATITGVDVVLGWHYLDLKGADGAWKLGTVPISVGRLVELFGQSLALDFFTNYHDTGTTLASLGITANDNGRAYWHGDDTPGRVAATAGWQKPGDGAAMTTTNSAAAAEFLNLQIAAFGCNVGLIGVAKGSTGIAVWQSGQTYGSQVQTVMNATGNLFEASFWFQGHSDAGDSGGVGSSTYSAYRASLDSLFTFNNSLNGRSYAKYLAAIPNINFASNWGNWRTRAMVRKAQEDWCASNGATYLDFADIELFDGVHENQLGARRIARHLHRATLAEIGAANDNGPRITGATRSGVDITLPIAHVAGSNLVAYGSPATRFRVTLAGDPAFAALALDAVTPITISASQIVLKLATDPGAGVSLDVWPLANTAVNDGSASMIYDDADAEGFGRGRQLYARPTPLRSKTAHTLDTNVATLVTAYAAGKFGQGRSSGEMQATLNGLIGGIPYNGLTIEGWITPSSVSTGSTNKVCFGQGSVAWIGQNNASIAWAVGSLAGTATGITLVAGQNYHVRLCIDPDGKSWRLYVNGTQTDAATNQNPTYAINRIFTIGGFANGGAVGQYHYTQGVVDEVAVFNKALTTGTSFTVPSAAYAGNEANLIHLWHCDGDGVDSAA